MFISKKRLRNLERRIAALEKKHTRAADKRVKRITFTRFVPD